MTSAPLAVLILVNAALGGGLGPDEPGAGMVVLSMQVYGESKALMDHDQCIKGVWLEDVAGKRHSGEVFDPCDFPSPVIWAGLPPGNYTLLPPKLRPYDVVMQPTPSLVVVPESGGLVNLGEWHIEVTRPTLRPLWTNRRDTTARDGGIRAAEHYAETKKGKAWAAWLVPAIEAERAALAGTGQHAQDDADAEAAYWAARPAVTFDDLLGVLGRPVDDPKVVEVRERKFDRAPSGADFWDYAEGYTIQHRDGSVVKISFFDDVPGWDPADSAVTIREQYGDPDHIMESEYGDSWFWNRAGWVLCIQLEPEYPHGHMDTTLMTSALGAQWVPVGDLSALPATTLCGLVGSQLDDPTVQPFLEGLTVVDGLEDQLGERTLRYRYAKDGVELLVSEGEIIQVTVSGPRGPLSAYRGPLPLGQSVDSAGEQLSERYGLAWDGEAWSGRVGACSVNALFEHEGSGGARERTLATLTLREPVAIELGPSDEERDAAARAVAEVADAVDYAAGMAALEQGCPDGAVYAGAWWPAPNPVEVWRFEVTLPQLESQQWAAIAASDTLWSFYNASSTTGPEGTFETLLIECDGHVIGAAPEAWCAGASCKDFGRFSGY